MAGYLLGHNALVGQDFIRATIFAGITVEEFSVFRRERHPDPIALVPLIGEIQHEHYAITWVAGLAQESEHIGFGAIGIQPFKACTAKIDLIESRFLSIQFVEIRHEVLQVLMRQLACLLPVQFAVVVPLCGLAELSAHKQ